VRSHPMRNAGDETVLTDKELDQIMHPIAGRASNSAARRKVMRDEYWNAMGFENWFVYVRTQWAENCPLPGEQGFNHGQHIACCREAIDYQRERLLERVQKRLTGRFTAAHVAECDRMFEAAMEFLCQRNPWAREAYRYDAAIIKQRRGNSKTTGIRLATVDGQRVADPPKRARKKRD